jgi:hypothetical protein
VKNSLRQDNCAKEYSFILSHNGSLGRFAAVQFILEHGPTP